MNQLLIGRRPNELNRSPPVFSIRCDAGFRRPAVYRMRHDTAFHLGREKTGVAGCDCSQAARAGGVRATARCCETFARAPHGATRGARRPKARASRANSAYRGCEQRRDAETPAEKAYRGRRDTTPATATAQAAPSGIGSECRSQTVGLARVRRAVQRRPAMRAPARAAPRRLGLIDLLNAITYPLRHSSRY